MTRSLFPRAAGWCAVLAGMLWFGWPPALTAQGIKGWSSTQYFPAPHERQKKTVFSGAEADPLANGTVGVKQLKIETFRENGGAELIVEAPDCDFDPRTRSANSPGPLQIRSADGKLLIKGNGFAWKETDASSTLTISNNVETTIQRDSLTQSGAGTAASATNAPANASQVIHVRAASFLFDITTNLITYRRDVRVEDSQMQLDCQLLAIQRAAGGGIETITADDGVVITSRASGGTATGDHAVYTTVSGTQMVTLTGNPRWKDGLREGTARAFVFEPANNIFRAEGVAFMKMPRESLSEPVGLLAPGPSPATNAPEAAVHFVEIYADAIAFKLSRTNGPPEGVTADRNVIIRDPDDASQASAEHAAYTAADGKLTLSGKAAWQANEGTPNERLARGDVLVFDRINRAFSADGHAYLKFPPSAISGTGATNSNGGTNLFVEINASAYDYRNDSLMFHGPVQAALLSGETTVGTLDCKGSLTADFTNNVVQRITAENTVHARQLPAEVAPGRVLERDLKSEQLRIEMRSKGLAREIDARQNVVVSQVETRAHQAEPMVLTINSDDLSAFFLPTTNDVEHIVAERNVIVTGSQGSARGAKAVYTAADGLAILTGKPRAEMPQGWVTADEAIIYNVVTGRMRAVGEPDFKTKPGALKKAKLPEPVNGAK
jgi:lipopolysaccharide export system protein LptA